MRIEIDEAENGWLIRSNESREPRVFEYDGSNKWRTTLEVRMVAVERMLNFVMQKLTGSRSYKVVVMEDTDDAKPIAEPVVHPVADLPTETFPG